MSFKIEQFNERTQAKIREQLERELNEALHTESEMAREAVSLRQALEACCFNCKHWIGKRRKETAYCLRLNLSGKDAPSGDSMCVLWEKRPNVRSTPNAGAITTGIKRHE
jgi:hypothetical protein